MEALTAASVAALTIYDMCKAVQKDMVIGPVRLLAKSGGKSGDFKVEAMIKVLFCAGARTGGCDRLTLDEAFRLLKRYASSLPRDDRWALALEEGKLLAAVNQTLVSFDIRLPMATKWRFSRR
jgi:hypothetical protein